MCRAGVLSVRPTTPNATACARTILPRYAKGLPRNDAPPGDRSADCHVHRLDRVRQLQDAGLFAEIDPPDDDAEADQLARRRRRARRRNVDFVRVARAR